MENFVNAICAQPNGTYVTVEWSEAGVVLGGKIETIYQTDNQVPDTIPGFVEYFAAAFRIVDVIVNNSATTYKPKSLMELSQFSGMNRISLADGTVIYENANPGQPQ